MDSYWEAHMYSLSPCEAGRLPDLVTGRVHACPDALCLGLHAASRPDVSIELILNCVCVQSSVSGRKYVSWEGHYQRCP